MKRCAPRLLFVLVIASVVSAGWTPASSGTPRSHARERPRMATPDLGGRQILVRFRRGADARSAHDALGVGVVREIRSVSGLQIVTLPAGVSAAEALDHYRSRAGVRYAERSGPVRPSAVFPNDPVFEDQWSLHNTGQSGGGTGIPDSDIDAPQAWEVTTGNRDVVVAVIDSGVDYTHPDLYRNIWVNEAECDGSAGVDDDANGWADDCRGIDAADDDADPMDTSDVGHGTHVSGIVGARGNNGRGIAGVSWRVGILPCKIYPDGDTLGAIADIVECLDYVAEMKRRGVNVVATNNSYVTAPSRSLRDAIRAHQRLGILFVASAGNAGANTDREQFFPATAGLPNVISVAMTQGGDGLHPFSNRGRRTVHIGAPGDSIRSTLPGNAYGGLTGTSQAAPIVAGVAALLEAQNPRRGWIGIRNLILAGGDPKPELRHTTVTGRRLNANGALRCRDREVAAPIGPLPLVGGGYRESISYLHIRCARPAGPVTVRIDGGPPLPLRDDGQGPDLAANDGIYSRAWTPPGPCTHTTHTLGFSTGDDATVRTGGPEGTYDCRVVPFQWRAFAGTHLDLYISPNQKPVSPGFPVQFGAESFDVVHVNLYGALSFGEAPIGFRQEPLPVSRPRLIAPFWSALSQPGLGSTQAVYWTVLGAAPHRELVIEWRNLTRTVAQCVYDATATVRFQVVLFEDRDDVVFSYDDALFDRDACDHFDRGGNATIGVQAWGGDATQVGFDVPVLRDDTTIVFTRT